ncbi:hypothetical protein PF002_g29492 [Phytophthora fragariae]|uniref:Uncharacterized protein n=1 Tax=Phytophthora fragariae TaxID=53985 RepID=A0A6A4BBT5_9STRA|nr:hypothetical protein PF002_g29492 [Phytophthora fragariae]KAE9271523.1 hypothetical protein PF001_g28339 [Phytophthora fragariae]
MPANLYQVEDALMPPVPGIKPAAALTADVLDENACDTHTASLAPTLLRKLRTTTSSAVASALAPTPCSLIPSQTLPLFQPSFFQLARGVATSAPAVFHVTSESIRRGMTVTGSYEPLYALQHSSAMLLNSVLPQVCHGG